MDGFSLSKMLVFLLAIIVLMPVAGLTWNAFQWQAGSTDAFAWGVLAEFFTGSLLLSTAVAIGVTLVGAFPAWLVAQFEFPGRRWLEWLLVLPLAMPAYIMAYGYADFLQYAGPLQTALRETFNWQARGDYWFPDIRSLPGAMLILTLALYPYVMPASNDPANSLTIANASSTQMTLQIMTWAAVIFLPLVLLYQGWTYWVFRKRISTSMIPPQVSAPAPEPMANAAG